MKTLSISVIAAWVAATFLGVLGDEISGIGVILMKDGQNVVVKGVMPDSPAATNRTIQPGARVIAISTGDQATVKTADLKLEQAVRLIRGPKGTSVSITVVQPGKDDSEAKVVTLVRGALKVDHFAEEFEMSPLTIWFLRVAIAFAHP